MLEPRPLTFRPSLLPKIWGGRRLGGWGKNLPPSVLIGESWELFGDAQGSPLCFQGEGRTLSEVAALWGRDFYGSLQPPADQAFPFLVKLMDARQDLSVQVHPGDELARKLHGPGARGKNEMWVVLEAAAGAKVLNGFKPGVHWGQVAEAVRSNTVVGLLQEFTVQVGDVIDVPAGRPHAIGAGCLVAEVQQNSDFTYRLWDYGRLEHGRPRALHLEEARQALRFDAVGCGHGRVQTALHREAWGFRESLVSNAHFSVERWTLKPGAVVDFQGRLKGLLAAQGSLSVASQAGLNPVKMVAGQAALAPAALAARLQAGPSECVVLSIEVPETF